MSERGGHIFKRLAVLGLLWVLLFLLWIVLVDTFDGVEMAAGAAASLIGAGAAEVARSRRLDAYGFSATALRRSGHIALAVVTDTIAIFRALVADLTGSREIRGAFRAVPFATGSERTEDEPLRAAATFKLSIAPNTYVVDLDTSRQIMLVHQLIPVAKDRTKAHLEQSL